MLTVIISTSNEIKNLIFWETLSYLNESANIQTITVINEKENPSTSTKIKNCYPNISIQNLDTNNRASRLNHGLQNSLFDLVLYQHPRTYLEPEAYNYLIENRDKIHWGAFQHQFDFSHPILQLTSWYSNEVRLKKGHIAYLDHCICINKKSYQINEVMIPEIDIFEDTILSKQLSKKYPPEFFPFKATTSSVRFQKNGILKQSLLNQILKVGFSLGFNHTLMNKLYEKGLSLNSKYSKK